MEVMTPERCTATAIMIPPDLSKVFLGVDAWARVKARARMDREDWRLIGEALLVGRRLHPGKQNDRAFSKWCRESGFGDMDRVARSNAIWLAENWDAVWGCLDAVYTSGLSHPNHIRQAYREATKPAHPLQPAALFTQADADYAMKLHRLAEDRCNANESGVARAKLERLAEDHGMTSEELVQKSRKVLDLDWQEKKQGFGPGAQAMSLLITQKIGRLDKKAIVELIIKMVMEHPQIISSLKEHLNA